MGGREIVEAVMANFQGTRYILAACQYVPGLAPNMCPASCQSAVAASMISLPCMIKSIMIQAACFIAKAFYVTSAAEWHSLCPACGKVQALFLSDEK